MNPNGSEILTLRYDFHTSHHVTVVYTLYILYTHTYTMCLHNEQQNMHLTKRLRMCGIYVRKILRCFHWIVGIPAGFVGMGCVGIIYLINPLISP